MRFPLFSSTCHPRRKNNLRVLRVLCVTHCLVCLALGISFYWNIAEADRSSARGQQLYKIGLRDGESFIRSQILRAELERQIIADQLANARREKL